jgi:excisionase family DNA binding protein
MNSPLEAGPTREPKAVGLRRRPPGGADGGAEGPKVGDARRLGLEKKHPKHENSSTANTDVGLPFLLDSSEIARLLGITERHVRRLVLERRIPFAKVGRFIRFDPRDIERWVEECKVPDSTALRHDVVSRREG